MKKIKLFDLKNENYLENYFLKSFKRLLREKKIMLRVALFWILKKNLRDIMKVNMLYHVTQVQMLYILF